jgi:hypothetical protein
MGKAIVTKFKWFWAWQDEAEEAWLEKMSQKGYHLISIGPPCFYKFTVGESRNYTYRLDYQNFYKKDKQEYLQLFQDAGWEHIGEMSAWQYFRKEAKAGEVNEIFTDVESKAAKYKRVLVYVAFFYIIMMVVLVGQISRDSPYPWWGIIHGIRIFLLVILLFFSYAIIRLAIRIKQLTRR